MGARPDAESTAGCRHDLSRVPIDLWTSVAAAGDLVRHIALARSGISLTPGTCSGPPQCPRVQQSQQNAPEVPRRANFLATVACSMEEGDVRRDSFWKGGDLRRPVRQRGMDYLRALLVTPYD